jgi:hypothetical protein
MNPFDFMPYLPATCTMDDGSVHERVVFFGKHAALTHVGKRQLFRQVPIEKVHDVEPSKYQLPPTYASRIVEGGETRMGVIEFTLVMNDGTEWGYGIGSKVVDFIEFPEGYGPSDVVDVKIGIVKPHVVGRTNMVSGLAPIEWCLYLESKEQVEKYELYRRGKLHVRH